VASIEKLNLLNQNLIKPTIFYNQVFITGCCEKNCHRRGNRGKRGKFALASGEEANNREKAREVYCPQDY